MSSYQYGQWPVGADDLEVSVTQNRYNVTAEENHCYFTTSGAYSHVTFVLPSGQFGMEYHFKNVTYDNSNNNRMMIIETQLNQYITHPQSATPAVQVWTSGVNIGYTIRTVDTDTWVLTSVTRADFNNAWNNITYNWNTTRTIY